MHAFSRDMDRGEVPGEVPGVGSGENRRKYFSRDKNLLLYPTWYACLRKEERELCQIYDVCICFHSKEDHEEVFKIVLSEHWFLKRKACIKGSQVYSLRCLLLGDVKINHPMLFFPWW